jgi:hypothetical protein
MRDIGQHRRGERAPAGRVLFCVILALLIVYNPFVSLSFSHQGSSLHTPARHRATVGASELQHFSPVQGEVQPVDLSLTEVREEVAEPTKQFEARAFERDVQLPEPDFVASVWSRPPPAL